MKEELADGILDLAGFIVLVILIAGPLSTMFGLAGLALGILIAGILMWAMLNRS